MAFIDYVPNNPQQQGGSSFSPLSASFHPPDLLHQPIPQPQTAAVSTQGPPLPTNAPLPPPYPPSYAICPNCHVQQHLPSNYSINNVCSSCNSSFYIPTPPLPNSISVLNPGSHTPLGELLPAPPMQLIPPAPRPIAQALQEPIGVPSPKTNKPGHIRSTAVGGHRSHKKNREKSTTGSAGGDDRFLMTSMVDVVETLFREPPSERLLPSSDGISLSASITTNWSLSNNTSISSIGVGHPQVSVSTASSQLLCQCGSVKVAMCMECNKYLCSSCITGHKQACKDSKMLIYPPSDDSQYLATLLTQSASLQSSLIEVKSSSEEGDAGNCIDHPDKKLLYFCFLCTKLVCKLCVDSSEHAQHKCVELVEAYSHIQPDVEDIIRKTQVELDFLQYSLADVTSMTNKVDEKQQEAISKAQQIFQIHRDALAAREKEVVSQINDIASKRTNSLKNKQEKIINALDSLKTLLVNEQEAVNMGNKPHLVLSHQKLSTELNRCHYYTSSLLSPIEDDSFILKSNASAAQSALKSLCTFSTAPYPPHCMATGVGLFHPRVNRLCTVILLTKDRAGEPCSDGGEKLFLQLMPLGQGNSGINLPANFRDNYDGSYSITFRPRTKGEHQLVVAIRGQHIKGSPFTIFVDGGREYGHYGNVVNIFGSEGSSNSQFCRPWGICSDAHGNIIIGDRSNHRIQIFDMNGHFKHKFGSEGVRPGQFNRPAGVAVTREGHIVVADKDNHRTQVLKIDGTFLFMFGSKGGNDGQMIYPYDVAVNQSDGRIAVTDTGNHRLLIFSHDGILLGKFGYKGYLCGHFDSPRGIAFNDEGHVIVSDFNVHHVLVIHPDGTTARILGSQGSGNGQFMRPQGIAVDHLGNFLVADTRNNRIVIMHSSGQFISKFGTAGTGPGQFDRPTSITVLPSGHLAVMDFGNSRVQIF